MIRRPSALGLAIVLLWWTVWLSITGAVAFFCAEILVQSWIDRFTLRSAVFTYCSAVTLSMLSRVAVDFTSGEEDIRET